MADVLEIKNKASIFAKMFNNIGWKFANTVSGLIQRSKFVA